MQPRGSAIDTSSADRDLPRSLAQRSAELADQHGSLDAIDPISSTLSATGDSLVGRNELEQSLNSFRAGFAAAESGRSTPVLKGLFKQYLPSVPFVWNYYTAVLEHLHLVGWTAIPVLQCLLEEDGRLLRVLDPLQSPIDCAAFMDSLDMALETEHKGRRPLVHRILRVMAQSAAEARRSTTEVQDCILLRLIERTGNHVPDTKLETLYRLALNLSESAENKLLLSHIDVGKRVKEVIISTIRNVAAAPDGFASAERALSYMPRHQLLGVVPAITLRLAKSTTGKHNCQEQVNARNMDTWLQLVHQVDVKGDTGKQLLDAALNSLAGTLGVYREWTPFPTSPKYFVRAVLLRQGLDFQVPFAAETLPRVQNVFADVLAQLQARPDAYTAFLDLALPLVARHAGLTILLRCIRTMEEKELPLSTQMKFEPVIAHELAELQLPTADLSETQVQKRAFALQACEKLINALSRVGYALPAMTEEVAELSGIRRFDNVLVHARANHALPIACRDATTDLPLMERVVLVHQLAHHYSQDTTRTQRAAWRSVYYLYKYLHTSSLPLGPLFTKAVVHVSITRPLMENRFVSARRLIWVCHLVARVEGDEVAARLENTFYTRRGDLISRAKQTHVGAGGSKQSKAHVGTMKRLGLI